MNSLELSEKSDGVVIQVRAQPGARRSAITGTHAGALKVAVCAAPERGKANEAIIAVLAECLEIPRSAIQQVSGATNRQKAFFISGESAESIRSKLHKIESKR